MAKNLSGDLQVASANRLSDGVVVWLDDAGEWTTRLDRAAIATTPATPADYSTEFLDYVIAVRVVDSLDEAIARQEDLLEQFATYLRQ